MASKSIVGDLINFRGLVYSPLNENGVIFLFGKVVEDLNMYIEEIKPGFPDCIARRYIGNGRWERIAIEFEHKSSNFKQHGHDANKCDIIVCWEHNWPDCPIEVIELKEIIDGLENEPVEPPDSTKKLKDKSELTTESHLREVPEKTQHLFKLLDNEILSLSDEIWKKVGSTMISYYSPKRNFVYVTCQKQGLKLYVFTREEKIENVESLSFYQKGGDKWGRIYLRNKNDLDKVMKAVKKALDLIQIAIKKNESTCWHAQVEGGDED